MDVECGKCGKMVSSNSVKVDTVNQWYVCFDCLKADETEKRKKYEHQKMQERESANSKVKVQCPFCNYSYLYDTWKKYPTTCPYCDKKATEYR